MGQYYIAVILKENPENSDFDNIVAAIRSFTFGCGSKLLEHSYLNNPLTKAIENLFCSEGPYYKFRLVWAGDYADHEVNSEMNLYSYVSAEKEIDFHLNHPFPSFLEMKNYYVSHTKKEFISRQRIREEHSGDFILHPLPLLTCEGNGQGGGDYYGSDYHDLVGRWARNVISVETERPPNDYTELNFDLREY